MALVREQLDFKKLVDSSATATLITQKELERWLDVSAMTIHLWRKRGTDPLPCRSIPTDGGRHRNYFFCQEVLDWLRRNRPDRIPKIGGGYARHCYA